MNKILTALLLLSLVSCAQKSAKKEAGTPVAKKSHPGWNTYTGSNYAIQYPSEWEFDSSGRMGTHFFIMATLDSANDNFKENVNLVTQDLGGRDIDLDKYATISEDQVNTLLDNGKILERKKMSSGDDDYYRFIYTGNQGQYHLKFEQYYWIKDKKAYVLTFTAEKNKFDSYQETAEGILNSFGFK